MVNVGEPTEFCPFGDTVLVCIDTENYENEPNSLTEIRITTLDTRLLDGVAPSQNTMN
jgi:hypothetical protein